MDKIDWLMKGLISTFILLIITLVIFLTSYMINPERYESIQHNNHIEMELKGE